MIISKQIALFSFFTQILIGTEASVIPISMKSSAHTNIANRDKPESNSDSLIENFYSIPAEVWLKVLGNKGHYHFGKTNPVDPSEDIFDHAVRYLYRFIPSHSAILDCGCGWGGPAKLLATEKSCKITGITTSFLQYEFIQNHVPEIGVIYKDLHKYFPQERFNTALFFESTAHISDLKQVFSNLFPKVDAILISDFIAKETSVYNVRWHMHFRTKEEITNILHDSGYELEYYEEIVTSEDVQKSAQYWLDNLAKLKEEEIVGQLAILKESSLRWKEYSDERRTWSIAIFYAKKNVQTAPQ